MAKGFNSRGMRGMGGGGMGMPNQALIKQAQKLQMDMQKAQEDLNAKEYEFSSGGGVVKATVSGAKLVTKLEINPEAVDPDDAEMLQDLIIAAINGAMNAASEDAEAQMSRFTKGLNLPF